jgi:hypothetical protein
MQVTCSLEPYVCLSEGDNGNQTRDERAGGSERKPVNIAVRCASILGRLLTVRERIFSAKNLAKTYFYEP